MAPLELPPRTRQIAECIERDATSRRLFHQGRHTQALERRRELAHRFYKMWENGELPDPHYGGALSHYVPLLWVNSLWPGACLTQDEWSAMFDDAGYSIDGEPADPPEDIGDESWILYRGTATRNGRPTWGFPDRRDIAAAEYGWCWTSSLSGAVTWAREHARSQAGAAGWAVFEAAMPCDAVLATLEVDCTTLDICDTRRLSARPRLVLKGQA
ncbi:hypothetical protein [Actinomadura sp. 3N407]|uniref:hypothetical protein n=1 Tax=Actinomadura sp. 3N407 TaxID=3457423 RepID=UPI003FCD1969